MRDVILHAFNWKYRDVAKCAARIAELGYGAVLLSPALYSDEHGTTWWQCYQPKDYRVIRSHLGNKADLETVIYLLHKYGVKVYLDIVFNHMANERRADPLNFPGEQELARYRQERKSFESDRLYGDLNVGLFSPWDFNLEGSIQDWLDLHQSTEHSLFGLPDLDLNDWVIRQQRACLLALNALGIDGYRVDAVKHLPEEHIRQVFAIPEMAGKFLFGEVLTASDHEEHIFLCPLMDTPLSFYDFPLFETIRRAFAPGGSLRELVNPEAFGQALPWNRAVTFTVTHDIPNNDGFRWQLLDPQDEFLATAYIMGRDGGVPMIYSDHNESADAHPSDRDRWANAWERPDITAMLVFHNSVHGLPQRSLYEEDNFIVLGRGDRGIVAINKSADWQEPNINTDGLRQGTYLCTIHGHRMLISGGRCKLSIPPRQAKLWLASDE